jgi:hypothetical protein
VQFHFWEYILPFPCQSSNGLAPLLHPPHRGSIHKHQLVLPREDESLGIDEAGLGPSTAVAAAGRVAGKAGLTTAQVHLVATIRCS